MQTRDLEQAGAFRLRRIRRFCAALVAAVFFLPVSTATASLPTGSATFAERAAVAPSQASDLQPAGDAKIELAQNRHRGGNYTKPPERGSSAQLEGGSSADRYGGSSADRGGVAGRYDPRNRSVRQFSARNRKREQPRPKQHDELDDQDQDPPRDRYSFTPPDPSQALGRNRD